MSDVITQHRLRSQTDGLATRERSTLPDIGINESTSLQSNIFCGDRQEKQRILNCVFDAEESGLIRLDEVELVMTHIETDRKVKAKVMKEISQFDKACRIEPDSIIGKVVFDMLE